MIPISRCPDSISSSTPSYTTFLLSISTISKSPSWKSLSIRTTGIPDSSAFHRSSSVRISGSMTGSSRIPDTRCSMAWATAFRSRSLSSEVLKNRMLYPCMAACSSMASSTLAKNGLSLFDIITAIMEVSLRVRLLATAFGLYPFSSITASIFLRVSSFT